MPKTLRCIRNHIHPHAGWFKLSGEGGLNASDSVLGCVAVLFLVIAAAYAIEMTLFP